MEKFDEILKEEINKVIASIEGQISDPVQKQAVIRMTMQLSALPARMARGEDVTAVFSSLQAEAALRGVSATLKAQKAFQDAWMNIIFRVVSVALASV
jgi:hypothetical protein